MESRQSFFLIALLLAALVFGPVVVLTDARHGPALKPLPTLERIVDAPNSVAPGHALLPEDSAPVHGLFPR